VGRREDTVRDTLATITASSCARQCEYTLCMKSKHMVGVYIKYWLAYCISIDVQMIYTLSLAHATLSTATSHKYTHLSVFPP
jgi:hypothetical protein